MALDEVPWGSLVVASSLPIREVDAHLTRPGPVQSNRGASGIDGFVSTALGIASVVPRTVALAGDISLIHDSNGFVGEIDMDLCVVVIDNGGGGLFDQLPQATQAPQYERLFVTPPQRDLAKLADLHGLEFGEVDDPTVLPTVISGALDNGGLTLIRVPVDRENDRAARAQLDG
jgi:2-succinyl-5-enolpyruvyl-6-hydroxy-3-cyclohexene-1-carboxylate synthase